MSWLLQDITKTLENVVFSRAFYVVREAGLEPARPEWTLEPESSESANSTTRACIVFRLLRHIITNLAKCQALSFRFPLFFAPRAMRSVAAWQIWRLPAAAEKLQQNA